MHASETKKIIRLISGIGIAALLTASAWAGYRHINDNPVPTLTDGGEKSVTSSVSYATPMDFSSDAQEETSSVPAESETEDSPPAYTEETVRVQYVRINQSTNLRAENSDSSKLVGVLEKNSEAEYISESGTRYKVKTSAGKTGWIIKSCGELYEKEITVRHAGKYVSGDPISLGGTQEGNGIAQILGSHHAVGASVAVIRNGSVAYTYEYGYADKEKGVKVTGDTKFRVASLSKIFTCMLALSEKDEGKLDLDGDLSKIMGFKFRHPSYPDQKVTMRMLLTHTSGLIDRDGEFSMTLKGITANSRFYVSPPGVKFLYCNLNLGIGGAVVEKAANQTISRYAAERFLTPMGIDASYDASYLSDKSLVANCYEAGTLTKAAKYLCRSQERGSPGVAFHLGQGGLLISAQDYAKLTTVLINRGEYGGRRYLSQEAIDEMCTPISIDTIKGFEQCIGLRLSDKLVRGRKMYFHNGASYGIYALMAFDPTDGSGIVVITSGALTARNKNTAFAVCDEIINYSYESLKAG